MRSQKPSAWKPFGTVAIEYVEGSSILSDSEKIREYKVKNQLRFINEELPWKDEGVRVVKVEGRLVFVEGLKGSEKVKAELGRVSNANLEEGKEALSSIVRIRVGAKSLEEFNKLISQDGNENEDERPTKRRKIATMRPSTPQSPVQNSSTRASLSTPSRSSVNSVNSATIPSTPVHATIAKVPSSIAGHSHVIPATKNRGATVKTLASIIPASASSTPVRTTHSSTRFRTPSSAAPPNPQRISRNTRSPLNTHICSKVNSRKDCTQIADKIPESSQLDAVGDTATADYAMDPFVESARVIESGDGPSGAVVEWDDVLDVDSGQGDVSGSESVYDVLRKLQNKIVGAEQRQVRFVEVVMEEIGGLKRRVEEERKRREEVERENGDLKEKLRGMLEGVRERVNAEMDGVI